MPQLRALLADGHGLHDGLHDRGARHGARAAARPSRPWTRGAGTWPSGPGPRSSDLVAAGTRPSDIMTRDAFENAIRTLHAIGGSTNAVIHLMAIAGRLGRRRSRSTCSTSSRRRRRCWSTSSLPGAYLMEDFYYAGGLPAVHAQIRGPAPSRRPDRDRPDPGRGHPGRDDRQRGRDQAARAAAPDGGSLAILRGNLCPDGAVLKVSAASPPLLQHEGRAVVFQERRRAARHDRRSGPRHPRPTTSSCSRTAGRSARRACPSTATCRCRRTCCGRA